MVKISELEFLWFYLEFNRVMFEFECDSNSNSISKPLYKYLENH
jgi:hypothetical protein